MLVSICIATCHRPQGLMALLESFKSLHFRKVVSPEIEIIVVENNHSGVALALCQTMAPTYPWMLRCTVEGQPGISYARNRGIAAVSPQSTFIVFIDDDEIVEPFWLDELLAAQATYQADIVNGPVLSMFDAPVADWVTAGHFFERKRHPTGTLLSTANTGNILVRADVLRPLNPVFDERFALTGSEDHHLFTRLNRMGYKIVYTNLAIAHEIVSAHRVTVDYLLTRSFRVGNSLTLCKLDFFPLTARFSRTVKGIGRILQGCILYPLALLRKPQHRVRALQHIHYGAGMLAAIFGRKYEIYRQAHQDQTLSHLPAVAAPAEHLLERLPENLTGSYTLNEAES